MSQVDQIEFQLPKSRWNEGSAFSLPVSLRLRDTGAAATPTTIHYRIDCLSTTAEIADWTTVSPASSFTLAITGAHNAILGGGERELKQVTVKTDDGLSTQYVGVARWQVINLYGSP